MPIKPENIASYPKDWKALVVSIEYVRECFDYNPDTGELRWKVRPANHFRNKGICDRWNTQFAGEMAGCLNNEGGYLRVRFEGGRVLVHRLIWFLITGAWPAAYIDHINRNRTDNRLINLREATRSQNSHNRVAKKSNKYGIKGVSLHRSGKFSAHIGFKGKLIYLGLYSSAKNAGRAYELAAKHYHGDFARTK